MRNPREIISLAINGDQQHWLDPHWIRHRLGTVAAGLVLLSGGGAWFGNEVGHAFDDNLEFIDDLPNRPADNRYNPEVVLRLLDGVIERESAPLVELDTALAKEFDDQPEACRSVLELYLDDGPRDKINIDDAVSDLLIEPGAPCGVSPSTIRQELVLARDYENQITEIQDKVQKVNDKKAEALREIDEEAIADAESEADGALVFGILGGLGGMWGFGFFDNYRQRRTQRKQGVDNEHIQLQLVRTGEPGMYTSSGSRK